ncbi:MIR domain protein, partial [Ichthyophthirius multifiliis]
FNLIDFPNEKCSFRFISCLKIQKQRSNIVMNRDVLNICCSSLIHNRKPYLYTNYQGQKSKESQKSISEDFSHIKIYANLEIPRRWIVNIYSFIEHQNQQKCLQIGDVIWLKLSELNVKKKKEQKNIQKKQKVIETNLIIKSNTLLHQKSNLNLQNDMQSQDNNIFQVSAKFDQYKQLTENNSQNNQVYLEMGKQDLELNPTLKYEIEYNDNLINKIKNQLFQNHCLLFVQDKAMNGLWKIEAENVSQGGILYLDSKFKLKNFSIGKYLTVKQEKVCYKNICIFQINIIQLFIQIQKDQFILDLSSQNDKGSLFQFVIINQQNNANNQKFVTNKDNTFNILRADFEDTWDSKFLMYSLPVFLKATKNLNIIKGKTIEQLWKERNSIRSTLSNINFIIKQFEQYVNNSLISLIDSSQEYGLPSQIRQNVLYINLEQYVLGILLLLLSFIFPSKEEFEKHNNNNLHDILDIYTKEQWPIEYEYNNNQNQTLYHEKFLKELFCKKYGLSYKLYIVLKQICKLNEQNQLYIFKFIHILLPHIGYGDFVCQTINDIFCKNFNILQNMLNNQRLLNTIDSQNILQQIIQKIGQFPRYQMNGVLYFLRNCCVLNNKAIYNNQQYIFNQEIFQIIFIRYVQIKKKTNLYQDQKMKKTKQKKYPYKNLWKKTKQKNIIIKKQKKQIKKLLSTLLKEKQYKYFKNQLDLYSSLCKDRNQNAYNQFQQIFKLNTCVEFIIKNVNIDNYLCAIFLRMISSLHINKYPNQKLAVPNLVRTLKIDLKKQQAILQSQMRNLLTSTISKIIKKCNVLIKLNNNERKKQEQESQQLEILKKILIEYLESKIENLYCSQQNIIYDNFMYEAINTLLKMLQFNQFSVNEQNQEQYFKNIERLIKVLAIILEFDYIYFSEVKKLNLKRKYEEFNKQNQTNNKHKKIFFKQRASSDFLLQKESSLDQVNNNENENIERGGYQSLVIQDSILYKIQNLNKVLQRYVNKTYSFKEENEYFEQENQIKIKICDFFIYLLDLRQDFFIENLICLFRNVKINKNIYFILFFLEKQKNKKNIFQKKLINFKKDEFHKIEEEIIFVLPSGLTQIGQQVKQEKIKNFTESKYYLRQFDEILNRPFLEILLFSFYNTQYDELKKSLLNLINKCLNQKEEFIKYINQLELLFQEKDKIIYINLKSQIKMLKNLTSNSNVWLNIDDYTNFPKEYEQIQETIVKLFNIESIFKKDNLDMQLYLYRHIIIFFKKKLIKSNKTKMVQNIFSCIGGNQCIYQLIEKGLDVLENKQIYNENILKVLMISFTILSQMCKYNTENQTLFFNQYFRQLQNYKKINIGQVEFMQEILKDNFNVLQNIDKNDLLYFVELISIHGQYTQFLDIYDIIINIIQNQLYLIIIKQVEQMYKKLQKNILFDIKIKQPFKPKEKKQKLHQKFYIIDIDQQEYKEKFTIIIQRALRDQLDIYLINNISYQVTANNLLKYLYQNTQNSYINFIYICIYLYIIIIFKNKKKSIQNFILKGAICDLLLCFVSSKPFQDQFYQYTNIFIDIITNEQLQLMNYQSYQGKYYILDKFLPLFNYYTQQHLKDLQYSQKSKDLIYQEKIYQFANLMNDLFKQIYTLKDFQVEIEIEKQIQIFNSIFGLSLGNQKAEQTLISPIKNQYFSQLSYTEVGDDITLQNVRKDFSTKIKSIKQKIAILLNPNNMIKKQKFCLKTRQQII